MSAVLAELIPNYVAATQAAYEEASPDTPQDIINSLGESPEQGETPEPDTEPETEQPSSFDDIINNPQEETP